MHFQVTVCPKRFTTLVRFTHTHTDGRGCSSGAISGSVSCSMTLSHAARGSRDSNQQPHDYWRTHSTSWAPATHLECGSPVINKEIHFCQLQKEIWKLKLEEKDWDKKSCCEVTKVEIIEIIQQRPTFMIPLPSASIKLLQCLISYSMLALQNQVWRYTS